MPKRFLRTPTFHRAVLHGETVYLSGIVADDKTLPAGGQTRQALEKIDELLKGLRSDATRLLQATVFLADMADKDEMNAAWCEFFWEDDLPARATVGVAALGPGTLVEIVAIAALDPRGKLNSIPDLQRPNLES